MHPRSGDERERDGLPSAGGGFATAWLPGGDVH